MFLESDEFLEITDIDGEIASQCATYYHDPVGFAKWAFEGIELDTWQHEYLTYVGERSRANAFNGVDPVAPTQISVRSGHGCGKGHPCNSPHALIHLNCNKQVERVKMIKWGDLKVGDHVFGSDGKPTKVTGVNHYRREHYKVSFDDGSSTIVSGDHDWNVRGRKHRRRGLVGWDTMSTQSIIQAGVLRPNGKAIAKQWEIPTCQPVEFAHNHDQPCHPFFMGVWLGDGCRVQGQAKYHKPYKELFEEMVKVTGYSMIYNEGNVRVICGQVDTLHDIFDKFSHERYIPDEYKYASVEQRVWLFKGLMNSDGECNHSGSIGYSSTSLRLAEDVIWLARSLGFKAMLQPTLKKGWYPHPETGERVYCKDCYRVTINANFNPFILKHRAEKWKQSEARYNTRWIASIEPVGMMDGMCIEVEAEDHLYLANDFIVTHNSFLSAILTMWILSTRPMSKGVVTSNTSKQLKTKTWSELGKWHKRCITGHWFIYTTESIYHRTYSESWRVDGINSDESNSDAFAGLHGAESSPWYLFDEASSIPRSIWEVANGGLTDGEPFFFAFGNPTQTTGAFTETFGKFKHRWKNYTIDSRTCKMTNKQLIQEWADDYGEDSDFFRVRVRGLPPSASDTQLIGNDIVLDAMSRTPHIMQDEPLVCGIDVSRGGADDTYIVFRRGRDGRSEKTYKIGAQKSKDSMAVITLLTDLFRRYKPLVINIDAGGLGGPIYDRLKQLGYPAFPVGFGEKAADEKKYKNQATEMWCKMRDWLVNGGCIVDDPLLQEQLTNREYFHNDKFQLVLERKKDMIKRTGLSSPDWADALALTFANLAKALLNNGAQYVDDYSTSSDYDPLQNM